VLVDEQGKPVGEASVKAYRADKGFSYAPGSETDVKGEFSIGGLDWGKYAVGAK
jgi:hypothetical protein